MSEKSYKKLQQSFKNKIFWPYSKKTITLHRVTKIRILVTLVRVTNLSEIKTPGLKSGENRKRNTGSTCFVNNTFGITQTVNFQTALGEVQAQHMVMFFARYEILFFAFEDENSYVPPFHIHIYSPLYSHFDNIKWKCFLYAYCIWWLDRLNKGLPAQASSNHMVGRFLFLKSVAVVIKREYVGGGQFNSNFKNLWNFKILCKLGDMNRRSQKKYRQPISGNCAMQEKSDFVLRSYLNIKRWDICVCVQSQVLFFFSSGHEIQSAGGVKTRKKKKIKKAEEKKKRERVNL